MIRQDDIIPQVSNQPLQINLYPPQSPKKPGIIDVIIPEDKRQQIRDTGNRLYNLLRLIVLLPLSMVNRIGNVYFWVYFVISSNERFDTWWKVLSFIGYIYYFTVGSILFFLIVPDLQTQVGQTDRSYGYFGGIFGELKGLVFRNRYSLPQTYLQSQQKLRQQSQLSFSRLRNTQNGYDYTKYLKYHLEIRQQSSIYTQKKIINQQRRIRQLQRYNLKQKLKQRLEQEKILCQKIKFYKIPSQSQQIQSERNSQYLNKSHHRFMQSQIAKNSKETYSRFKQINQRQQPQQNEEQLKKNLHLLQQIRKQQQISIQKQEKDWQKQEQLENLKMKDLQIFQNNLLRYQKYFNQPMSERNFSPKFEQLFKEFLKPIRNKNNEKHENILQQYMDQELKFLIHQIKLISALDYFGNHFHYGVILNQTLQYYILEHEIKYLPKNEKQHLISLINVKKKLKELNAIQVKQKKFYLFLFNLLNATDAMIAWYDYHQLPGMEKLQKFQSSYYFLILFFQQIPQIIAQGCSLSYVYDNKINIVIFGISVLKIAVCTIYKLYKVYNNKKNQNENQARKSVNKPFIQVMDCGILASLCCCCCILPITAITISLTILPIANRILFYIFLDKIRENDQLLFWASIICLAYYFIVGNSLTIISFKMLNIDREQNQKYFPPKLVISLIIILLNIVNGCFSGLILFLVRRIGSSTERFYSKYLYIHLAFEAIPFTIIYLLAISRSQNQDNKIFYIILPILMIVCLICYISCFCLVKRDQDKILKTFKQLTQVKKSEPRIKSIAS